MTVKFTRAAQTYYSATDAANLTFPSGDWSVGFSFVLDGSLAVSTTQYFVSTGNYQTPGSIALFLAVDASGVARLNAYINAGGASTCVSQVLTANGAYEGVFVHSGSTVNVKCSPVLTTLPTTGASVVTGTLPATLTTAMDSTFPLTLGTRSTFELTRALDHSAARFFLVPVALSDLEIAKLAYGMELSDLGYTPSWYCRLNDPNDFTDRGSLGVPFAKTGTPATGTPMGFGFVPTTSAPAFTSAPAINGTPQVGTSSSYTRGGFTGTPTPDVTQQWYVAGVAVSGATGLTYIPVTGDVGKALTVRQILNNSQGGPTTSDSAAKTVTAAANAVSVAELVAEKIYSRIGTSAVVDLSGAYTGTQPTTIEYQLYAVDRTTVRQAWTSAGANIVAGGTWTASPTIPQHAEKYTIAVRTKDSGGTVLATSVVSTNKFGVGLWICCVGSSSAATWFGSGSGGAFTPNTTTTSYADPNVGFRNFDANGIASQTAIYYAQQYGCVVGMLSTGSGGSTVNDLSNTGSSLWTTIVLPGLALVGNRVEGIHGSSGSNDASNNYLVTSVDQHLTKLRAIAANLRSVCNAPNLPILWSGMNSRPGSSGNAAGQDPMSDWVRQAENIFGYDTNVYHVSSLDFQVGTDGVHLTGTGFQAQMARIQYVWIEAIKNSIYHRGPRIIGFTFLSNVVTATLEYRQPGANDFTPTTGAIGFSITDASGTPNILSVTRGDATHPKITCDRPLVAPVVTKFLSGGAPSIAAPIYDNATVPLPLVMESALATTQGAAPVDSQAPTLTNASATQTGSTTASGSVATDEANGTLYFLVNTSSTAIVSQVQAGSTKAVTATGVQSVSFTGLPAATLLYPHFVHVDAAGNVSEVANGAGFTTAAAPDTTAPTLSAASATSTGTTTATASVTTNEGNGTLYSLVSTATTATATQVKAGSSQLVTTAGAKTVNATGLPSSTAQYFYFLHRDASGNESAVLRSPLFTTATETPQQGNGQSGITFIPSKARTLKVKAAALTFEGGAFWDLTIPRKPSGRKDPDSIIDITLDWSDVLDDITDTIAGIDWTVKNATSTGSYPSGALTTLFVAGGTVSTLIEITATMTSASNPPRKEDRTVYLKVEQL